MGRTGPIFRVELRTGKFLKGYVPRKIPAAIQAIKEEMIKMKWADLIEESNCPYSAPIVVGPKPDGVVWVCINLRPVNMDINNDANPMHQIEDQLEAMEGSKVLKMLDLKKVYYQLFLHE